LRDFNADCQPPPGLPLKGERITVRVFRREDEERRQGWAKFDEPYLVKYNFAPAKSADNDLNFRRLRDRIRLSIDRSSGEMIGYASLKPLKADHAAAELGICFAADQVEKGFGTEAMGLLLPWARVPLNLRRIILEVDAVNERAIRLYQCFGFSRLATSWKRDDNPLLKAHLIRSGPLPGLRWRCDQLEVLSWTMEWRAGDCSGR